MASSLLAHCRMLLEVDTTSAAGVSGTFGESALKRIIEIDTRWTEGNGSGQVQREFFEERALTAAATQSYNLLAAGSLTDRFGQAIDADEIKALIIKPVSGSFVLNMPAANGFGLMTDPTDLINIPSGGICMSWGAAGLDVTTNGKFDITDTGAAGTYQIAFIVAQ